MTNTDFEDNFLPITEATLTVDKTVYDGIITEVDDTTLVSFLLPCHCGHMECPGIIAHFFYKNGKLNDCGWTDLSFKVSHPSDDEFIATNPKQVTLYVNKMNDYEEAEDKWPEKNEALQQAFQFDAFNDALDELDGGF